MSSQAIADLEAGLAALKQKEYSRAIALLETRPLPLEHPLATKAQMGLVVAYTRSGKLKQALTLCETLAEHRNGQVRDWAAQTLANLERRAKNATPDKDSQVTETSPARNGATDESVDLTGFVPFDGASDGANTLIQNWREDDRPEEPQHQVDQEFLERRDESQQADREVRESREELAPDDPSSSASPLKAASLPLIPYSPTWRQAERAKAPFKSLGRVDVTKLWGLQVITAIALFWVLQQTIYWILETPNVIVRSLPFLRLQTMMFNPPFWSLLVILIALGIGSRWILDALLTMAFGLQPLSLSKLGNYSPEAIQSLNRFCRQRQVPMPDLGVLPSPAPLAFSYGVLPRVTRVVVSQGLLEQLADDEIAAILAAEVGHISYRDGALMSLIMVVIQIPYTVYCLLADWGNRQVQPILRGLATWGAATGYGLYCLFRFVGLWLSRSRIYYSDRVAAELTGNPNGLTRALLKIAIGTAKDVQSQGQTSYLLEGFDLLTPLGHRMATPLGSLYPHTPLEPVLEWEWTNPLRHWLAINNSHPPTGERLHLLTLYARHWKLVPELDLNRERSTLPKRSGLSVRQWGTLLLQGAPYFGMALGGGLALLLSLLGSVGWRLGSSQLLWLAGAPGILQGLALVGLSLGTFVRINPSYPDVPAPSGVGSPASASVVSLMQNPTAIPIQGEGVRLEGKLLGRPGIANRLSQDLLLQTETGLIWLHCVSPFGPLGNLLPRPVHFTDLIGQSLTATGWFRRGATAWLDIDVLRTVGGRVDRSNHPLWATLVGLLATLAGIYAIAFFKIG
jgi:Zn-dependent protease with chaperone function